MGIEQNKQDFKKEVNCIIPCEDICFEETKEKKIF